MDPRWRNLIIVAVVALVIGIGIGAASGGGDTTTATDSPATVTVTTTTTIRPPAVTVTVTPTPKKKAKPTTHRTATTRRPPAHRGTTVSIPGVPAADLPVAALTPGVVLTTSAATVCRSGYASSVRDVPQSEKDDVYARYHVAYVPYAHEVDHLVSLELGGSNSISNLWPEPYAGSWGARTKDVLENKLHDLVCAGSLTLPYAQHIEATNWVAAYKQYVGSPPAPAQPTQPAPPTQTQQSGGGCEPGYSPCLPIVSDLDCSQIPDSDKPVRVTGSDPYRLDEDGDGWGCES